MWQSRKCARQMTVLAVGAAATAVATAATASPTRYERTLRNCARALSDFAGCTEPGAVWDERSTHASKATTPEVSSPALTRMITSRV